MTCNIQVLFTSDSEKLVKDLINNFDNEAINAVCVDNNSYHLPDNHHRTKSKIHVIFFSPDFLRFLEDNPLEAYCICGHLEVGATLALFCGGLREKDVLCYHMAPLKSFSTWSKFEVLEDDFGRDKKERVFPKEFIDRIREVVEQDVPIEVVIVPRFLNKQNNVVHLIFSKKIPDSISIHLNDSGEMEINPEVLNPYALKFCIPDSLFQFSHNISISVREKDKILLKQMLHVSQSNVETASLQTVDNTFSHIKREDLNPDEPVQILKRFSCFLYDDEMFQTLTESSECHNKTQKNCQVGRSEKEADLDLRELCEHYGLEELSLLISDKISVATEVEASRKASLLEAQKQLDTNVPLRRASVCKLPEMDASNRMDSYLVEETDVLRLRCTSRSLSLPPTLFPTFLRNSDGHYMEMGGGHGHKDMKPHEKLLLGLRHSYMGTAWPWDAPQSPTSPPVAGSFSTERYASVTLDEKVSGNLRALLKKGLSPSQQELLDLMQDFKEGECTISNVERQFQLWTERHHNSAAATKRTRKTSAFALPWKKPKKRSTKQNQNKECVKANADKQEEHISSRKISNTSASSGSSKTSDTSARTISPKWEEKNSSESIDPYPTGWVSSYTPSRGFCPLYPERNPPPLPSRPPPKTSNAGIRPTPLPRKKAPAKEETRTPLKENRGSPEIKKECVEKDESEHRSIVGLCHKYGLEELSERFVSGKGSSNDDLTIPGIKEITYNGDSECSPKPSLREFEEETQTRLFSRSASLPSNLHKSGEFSDTLQFHATEEENPQLNPENTALNSCNCEQCYEMADSLASNVYMSLLEFQQTSRHLISSSTNPPPLSRGVLSGSQRELLDLMYAFKRGDKNIAQVEEQFREWHSKHAAAAQDCPFSPQDKHEKQRKLGLPGLKSLILRKPKKKSDTTRYPEHEYEMKRTKKLSESSSTSQKRLSKISNTSTSSGTSEYNDVFKMSTITSVGPPFPKRPPPMPPVKPVPPIPAEPSSFQHPAPDHSMDEIVINSRPVPPPKPKSLFKQNKIIDDEPPMDLAVGKHSDDVTEETKEDGDEKNIRSSSPIYIVPDVHVPRLPKKKISDPKSTKRAEKCLKKDDPPKLPRLKLPNKDKPTPKPNLQLMSPTGAAKCRKISVSNAPVLPPQTLQLLKMANLMSFPEEDMSKFYIRRSKSFPNLRVSQLQNHPVYLELIGQIDLNLRRSSLFSGSERVLRIMEAKHFKGLREVSFYELNRRCTLFY